LKLGLDRFLPSPDIFITVETKRYGGNGQTCVTEHFLPCLIRFGLTPARPAIDVTTRHSRKEE